MSSVFPKDELLATMRCRPTALLPCKLDWPVRKIRYWGGHPRDCRPIGQTTWQDAWGITWRKESPDPALAPFPVGHPLESQQADITEAPLPDPKDPHLYADLSNLRPSDDTLLIGEHPYALYERTWLLCGFGRLTDLVQNHPAQLDNLMERIVEFERQIAEKYIELGVEVGWISDDYGMSQSLLLNPERWRRFVRPHLEKLVDTYHQADRLVALHSCGHITPLINDLLEIGIDVLDPLQPACNELGYIREKTAGRMCLSGGVATSVLQAGDADRTLADTKTRIAELGTGGGYIVGPDHDWNIPSAARSVMLAVVEQHRDNQRSQGLEGPI